MPYILNQDAIKTLSKRLDLALENYMQDWELELADRNRIPEFIEFYSKEKLSESEKYALAALLISSLDTAFEEDLAQKYLAEVAHLLVRDRLFLKPIIEDWIGYPSDDYAVSAFLRSIMK